MHFGNRFLCIFGTVHFGNRFLWCVLGTGVNDEENLRRRLGDEKRSLFRDRITARKGERETRL